VGHYQASANRLTKQSFHHVDARQNYPIQRRVAATHCVMRTMRAPSSLDRIGCTNVHNWSYCYLFIDELPSRVSVFTTMFDSSILDSYQSWLMRLFEWWFTCGEDAKRPFVSAEAATRQTNRGRDGIQSELNRLINTWISNQIFKKRPPASNSKFNQMNRTRLINRSIELGWI